MAKKVKKVVGFPKELMLRNYGTDKNLDLQPITFTELGYTLSDNAGTLTVGLYKFVGIKTYKLDVKEV